MEFLLLFTARSGLPAPTPADMAPMGELARELAEEKILKRGFPLAVDAEAACVRVRDGRSFVSDGPFAESKEVVAGAWVVDVADRDEAIALASRCPHARHDSVWVQRLEFRGDFGDTPVGKPFLLVFRMEPGLRDADGAKGREMRAFGEKLVPDGTLVETGKLASDEPPALVRVRNGKALVTDGPFAESKEAIGGYGIVRVAGRRDAVEQATRWPHARWGPVEVREILFFDRV
jgi:hypothetical protein